MNDSAARPDDWMAREELAERMIPLIGALKRERDVVTSLHGHRLLGLSATGLVEVHERVAQLGHEELALVDTLAVLEGIHDLAPGASSLDVARLVAGHAESEEPLDAYLARVLAPAVGAVAAEPTDVVLYGFGRIGRLLARILIAHTGGGSGLRLRAIVVRRGSANDLVKRASLLLRDSVHGRFAGSVTVDEEASQIIANGTRIQVIYSDDPASIDYTAYGIRDAIVVDNCGTEVSVHAAPQRILTIKSSTLELALALGAGDRIIGSAFSDGPLPEEFAADADGITLVSDKVPSQEATLELEPDLVFAGWESNFSIEGVGERADLQKLGITTYVAPAACKAPGYMPNPLTFETVFEGFEEAGAVLGETDAAEALIADQRAQLDAITPDDRELAAVWYSSGTDEPFVGAGIGAPQMIMTAAGLENVFADVEDTWTSSSWELIAEADPDVIVLVDAAWNTADSKIAQLAANPITAQLDAVVNERYVIVEFPATEAGIRNVDAVESIVMQLGEL